MQNQNQSTLIVGLILAFFLLNIAISTLAQEVENESGFDYVRGSKKGPHWWGVIKKEWAACKNGKMQSPIDMSNKRVKIIKKPHLKQLRNYKPSNATVINRGHDIMVKWEGDAGSISVNNTQYLLHQAHWHSPSEHTINGRRYAMELHMVHESTNKNVKNNIFVLSVLYSIGKPDPFLSKLKQNISSFIVHGTHKINHGEMIDPRDIKVASKSYYRYMGSLTVPPCTEGVMWTITRKVRTVSRDQVNLLREAVHDHAEKNARPLQPHNNRDIYLYKKPCRKGYELA